MADSTLAALTALATLNGDELIYCVDDPAGTPLDRKVTARTIRNGLLLPGAHGVSSSFYIGPPPGSTIVAAAQSANVLYMMPFFVADDMTVVEIGVNVTVASAGNARLGIYNMVGVNNQHPGTLVSDCGTVSVNVTNTHQKITSLSVALKQGWYHAAYVSDATPTIFRLNAGGLGWFPFGSGVSNIHGWSRAYTYAALPADETAETYGNATPPAVFMR